MKANNVVTKVRDRAEGAEIRFGKCGGVGNETRERSGERGDARGGGALEHGTAVNCGHEVPPEMALSWCLPGARVTRVTQRV
jgi:hypothetical protein